jgi:hypothetical protein
LRREVDIVKIVGNTRGKTRDGEVKKRPSVRRVF